MLLINVKNQSFTMEVVLICDLNNPVVEFPTPFTANKVKVLEIIMPKKYINVQKSQIEYFESGSWKQFSIERGFYTADSLLSFLNQFSSNIIFSIDICSDCISIYCLDKAQIKLSPEIQQLFDFTDSHLKNGRHVGGKALNLEANKPIMVMCSFVKNRLVNGKNKQLLHVLSEKVNTVDLDLNTILLKIFKFEITDINFKPVEFFDDARAIIRLWFS